MARVERTATDSKRDASAASQRRGAILAFQGRRGQVKSALDIGVQAHQEVAVIGGTRYHSTPFYCAVPHPTPPHPIPFHSIHKSAEHRMLLLDGDHGCGRLR